MALTLTGDPVAYGRLVARYRRSAYALALSVTGRHEDAEDTAQEAFIVALDRLEECRDPDKFGGWFMTIVRNRGRNLVRREALREGEELPYDLSSREPGPDRVAERAELTAKLARALSRLSDVQRDVVLLHDLEGWKHREIAERLGVPPGTVRSHLHYARKKLRGYLGGESGAETEKRKG